jgi:xanthine/CO dehydrogenase XdhC/CoxF family maturation factor
MVVTIVAIIVAIRRSIVSSRSKRVTEQFISPRETLISLTHDHPLDSNSLSKALPYQADWMILALGGQQKKNRNG